MSHRRAGGGDDCGGANPALLILQVNFDEAVGSALQRLGIDVRRTLNIRWKYFLRALLEMLRLLLRGKRLSLNREWGEDVPPQPVLE
jgi:hypothetical protein